MAKAPEFRLDRNGEPLTQNTIISSNHLPFRGRIGIQGGVIFGNFPCTDAQTQDLTLWAPHNGQADSAQITVERLFSVMVGELYKGVIETQNRVSAVLLI